MPTEAPIKPQNLLWWITSIATSVACCSVLFVFFASYLVDLRTSARDNTVRMDIIEQRESQILGELEIIRKHAEGQTTVAPAAETAPETATPAVEAAPHVEVPVVAPPTDKK